jgi:hypothetical protein
MSTTLCRGTERLEIRDAGPPGRKATRIDCSPRGAAVALLRRFADPAGKRALRAALAAVSPGRDVRTLSDAAVLEALSLRLAGGALRAFVWTEATGSLERERASVPEVSGAAPLTWVEIRLVDTDGYPLAGERFILKLSDGTTRDGELDAGGSARVESIPAGSCRVSFPDLDETEWRPLG